MASLDVLEAEPVYEHTESQAERVRAELAATYADLGIDATVLGTSSMFLSHFHPEAALTDIETVEIRTNRDVLVAFHHRLLDHGYYFLPGHMGSVSYQTTADQINGFLAAARTVAAELQVEGIL